MTPLLKRIEELEKLHAKAKHPYDYVPLGDAVPELCAVLRESIEALQYLYEGLRDPQDLTWPALEQTEVFFAKHGLKEEK